MTRTLDIYEEESIIPANFARGLARPEMWIS